MITALYNGVKQFMTISGQIAHAVKAGGIPSEDQLQLRERLIKEEFEEYKNAVMNLLTLVESQPMADLTDQQYRHELAEVADALCDLMYVTVGAGITWGFDLDAMLTEVQRVNMTKFPGGKVYRREDGKVAKPPGFKHVDLTKFLPPTTFSEVDSPPAPECKTPPTF